VSNLGNFKDAQKRDISVKVDSGYLRLVNWEKDKSIYAHRLVMLTWRPIPHADRMTVDHLDHNKRNNKLKNLEWVPSYENLIRANADIVVKTEKMENEIKEELNIKHLQDFHLLVNNTTFKSIEDATNYVKQVIPYLDSLSITEEKIKKVFKTLVNAYNNKVPIYLENGFTKEKYNCKFSIILKGE
jgi:hypothetical protein